jgi:hypothetical protein
MLIFAKNKSIMEERKYYELNIKNNIGMKVKYYEYPSDMNIILDDLMNNESLGKIIGINSYTHDELIKENNVDDNTTAIEDYNPFSQDLGLDKKKVHPRYRKYL